MSLSQKSIALVIVGMVVFPAMTAAHTQAEAGDETLYYPVYTVTPEGSTKTELMLNNAEPLAREKIRSAIQLSVVLLLLSSTVLLTIRSPQSL